MRSQAWSLTSRRARLRDDAEDASSLVLPILRYRVYSLGQLTATTEQIVVADRIPVGGFARLGLSLRQHRKNVGTGNNFQFFVYHTNPSGEDGQDFIDTASPLGSTTTITGSGGAELLELTGGLAKLGSHPMVRVVLAVVAGGSVRPIFGIFSADLVLNAD